MEATSFSIVSSPLFFFLSFLSSLSLSLSLLSLSLLSLFSSRLFRTTLSPLSFPFFLFLRIARIGMHIAQANRRARIIARALNNEQEQIRIDTRKHARFHFFSFSLYLYFFLSLHDICSLLLRFLSVSLICLFISLSFSVIFFSVTTSRTDCHGGTVCNYLLYSSRSYYYYLFFLELFINCH